MFMGFPFLYYTDILTFWSRLTIRYKLHTHGTQITSDEMQIIDNKWTHLQQHINVFEHQADSFLLHQRYPDTSDIPPLNDYDQYDLADNPYAIGIGKEQSKTLSFDSIYRSSDGSGMENAHPEDHLILLLSTLGWDWCITNGAKSLAVKEAKLHHAQAHGAIHCIHLALGFKSAVFRTQVRTVRPNRPRHVHGTIFTVWTQLSMNMCAFTAWLVTHSGISIRLIRQVQSSHSSTTKIFK
jgi:hypothetical protein